MFFPENIIISMNNTTGTPKNSKAGTLPDLKRLLQALNHLTRWKMLRELTCGEARSIGELGVVGGCRYENAVHHLRVLARAGLVVQGRGQLYQIPKQHLPTPGQAVVDYGHCLLRLDVAG